MQTIKLYRSADLSAAEAAALRVCSSAVYPPEVLANLPSRAIEWTPAQWRVLVWDDDDRVLCHVGIVLRQGKTGDHPALIGGIGGVMTHPDARGQGHATHAIKRALAFIAEQRADFALLVCKPELVALYEKMGWRLYKEPLMVTQRGEQQTFTFNVPMVHSVHAGGPPQGTIDLAGPPW